MSDGRGLTKVCKGPCGERKYLREFHRNASRMDGYNYICKSCRRKVRPKCPPGEVYFCLDCGTETKGRKRCDHCRAIHQATVEAAFAEQPEESFSRCMLPIDGGHCTRRLFDGTDKLGRSVVWCSVHGERLVELKRPGGYVRYSQRDDWQRELESFIEKAKTPVNAEMSERSRGRVRHNFVVGKPARGEAA